MSFTLHGIPVSRGIAIGRAYLIAPAALDVDHYLIEPTQIEGEVERFRAAQQHVHRELDTLRADLAADVPAQQTPERISALGAVQLLGIAERRLDPVRLLQSV